jgi:hypothetical protein
MSLDSQDAPLSLGERALYHQIHSLKLLTDWVTAMVGAWAFWEHRLVLGLLVGILPPVLVSIAFLVVPFNLQPLNLPGLTGRAYYGGAL